MIRRVPEITAEQENARLVRLSPRIATLRRDPVEPVPVGSYVALMFRVEGYDQDCDGSLMARLAHLDAEGQETGWCPSNLGLGSDTAWVLDSPADLDGASGA